MTKRITQADIDAMAEVVRRDLDLAPEFWSKQDIDDMRACGMRPPKNAGKGKKTRKNS